MANVPAAGASVRVAWKEEATFKTEATPNKAFGQGVKLTNYDIDNSVEYIYSLGSQSAQASVCKEFKGSWGIEMLLSDPWWLCMVNGAVPVTTGSAPYVHTYTPSNDYVSSTISVGFDLDTDTEHKLLGSIVTSCTISTSVGETVKVRLDGSFADFAKDGTLISLISPVEEPFTFAQGTLEVPNSTTQANVQSVEMIFNRNPEMVWGLGSRIAQQMVNKQREWGIRATITYENDDQFWDDLLGSTTAPVAAPAEIATATITFTNGLTGDDMRKYVFNYADVRIEKGTITAEVENVIKQDIVMVPRTLTSIVVSNGTSAMP